VSTWTDLAVAISDIRAFVNDGPFDKLVKQKALIGEVNGSNDIFMTFEDRLTTVQKITVDFIDIGPAFTLIDAIQGFIQLTTPPAPSSVVRAAYYYQFFLDSELTEAVTMATGEILGTEDPTQVPIGLKQATMAMAGYFGFTKQSIRWATRMSMKFLLEEEPVKAETMNRSNLFGQIAKSYFDQARTMRDDYYKRQSRSLAPAFGMFKPRIPTIGPRR